MHRPSEPTRRCPRSRWRRPPAQRRGRGERRGAGRGKSGEVANREELLCWAQENGWTDDGEFGEDCSEIEDEDVDGPGYRG